MEWENELQTDFCWKVHRLTTNNTKNTFKVKPKEEMVPRGKTSDGKQMRERHRGRDVNWINPTRRNLTPLDKKV